MSKYIEAEKLIAEIERQIEETKSMKPSFDQFWAGQISAFKGVRTIIASLQQEQPTKGYDEAYLNECIAKARKTWKGVDVDKYMDEMREREQEQPDVDLEKEIERIVENEERFMKFQVKEQLIKYVARHFAEWGAIHLNARKEESK